MRLLNRVLTGVVVLLAVFVFSRVLAATIFVDAGALPGGNGSANAPFQTIQEGVDAASPGDLVQVAPGLYNTTTSRVVAGSDRTAVVFMKDGVTVRGAGAGVTLIDGGGAATGVVFDSLAATLDAVTVQNGKRQITSIHTLEGGGGIFAYASSPTITNSAITGNRAYPYGGGVLIANGGTALLAGNVISNNDSIYQTAYPFYGSGGGIAVYRAAAALSNNTLASNRASEGGGFAASYANLTLSSNTFTGNVGVGTGSRGGAFNVYYTDAQLSNNIVDGNVAQWGGGLYFWYSRATLSADEIRNNGDLLNTRSGGGAYGWYSDLTMSNVTFQGNQAGWGGAMYLWRTAAALTGGQITGNTADGVAGIGGYYHDRLTLSGTSITGNTAADWAGGLYLAGYSYLAIDNSLISGNVGGFGGGIYSYYNQEKITNSTISNNSARYGAGGIYSGYGRSEITGNVISGNVSQYGYGGGIYSYASKGIISRNEFSANSAYSGGAVYLAGECTTCFDTFSSFMTFANNFVEQNTATGYEGGGLYLYYNTWLAVTNNTIVGNRAPSGRGGGIAATWNYSAYLSNNIIQGNSAGDSYGGGGVYYGSPDSSLQPVVTNNDIVGNTPDDWATYTYYGVPSPIGTLGNISADPLFVDAAARNYGLQAASPAVDAGTNFTPGFSGPDRDGQPRLQNGGIGGAKVDMGAFERAGSFPGNSPPVARVAARGAFRYNGTVVLDGSRSFDPDGDLLTFYWSQVAGPPVTLASATAPFTAIQGVGTGRVPPTPPFSYQYSLPTSLLFDLTVSDGKSSDTQRLEVRMIEDGLANDIEIADYLFDQELGVPGYLGGIAFSTDGSTIDVIAEAGYYTSHVMRGPVQRDSTTGRITGMGPFHRVAMVLGGIGMARHPGGTLFVASILYGGSGQQLIELRPDGSQRSFDILGFGLISPFALAFVPPGLPNAGTLLLADHGTNRIYQVALQDNGDGTFTPTGLTPFVDLSATLSQTLSYILALTFLGPPGGDSDLLVFTDGNQVLRVDLDAATGLPVGGASAPVVTVAYDDLSFDLLYPYGADRDPITDTVVATNPEAWYPFASTLLFDPAPADFDRDAVEDEIDNCPTTPNLTQADANSNGVGDACDNLAPANSPPTANAGPDQAVDAGSVVTLNGTASSDPDGDPLSFAWSQTGGPAVTLSSPSVPTPTFTAPDVATVTFLTFSLTVTDLLQSSLPDTITVTVNPVVTNQPPVANAGPDQAVNEFALVALDGSASSDPDPNTVLAYSWVQTGGPTAALSGATTAAPTFVAPAVGSGGSAVTFALTVSDGLAASSPDSVTVTIANVNDPPTIQVSVDPGIVVSSGTLVGLDASATTDPDPNSIVTFTWQQLSGPTVTLSPTTGPTTSFTAPVVGTTSVVGIRVIASDGLEQSQLDTNITINPVVVNLPPVADAGPDRRGTPLTGTIALDGGGSSDPEAQPLTYEWVQTGGTSVPLSGATTSTASIDVSGVTPTELLSFELTVGDGTSTSTDSVAVQVVPVPDWHEFRRDAANSGETPSPGPQVGSSAFAITFPAGIRSSVSFDYKDGMYVGADDGKMYALNLDGTVRWAFPTGQPVRTTPLVAPDGTIYFGSFNGSFYALNPDGTQRWTASAGAGTLFRFSSPVLYGGYRVIVGASDGVLRAFDASTGSVAWSFATGGPIYSSPAVHSGQIVFGSNDGVLRALDGGNGSLLWAVSVGAPIQASPAIDTSAGRLYVGSDDGRLRAFDAATHAEVWSFATGGAITSSAAIDVELGRVYVGSDDHNLYGVNASTGEEVFRRTTGAEVRSSPVVDGPGHVFVASCDGNVYGFEPLSSESFTFYSRGIIVPSPTIGTDGLLYIGSADGFLYAIGADPFGAAQARAPRLDAVEPPEAPQGAGLEVAVAGADLTEGMELGFGPGVKVVATRWVSSREVRASLVVEAGAALGPRDVVALGREGLPSTRLAGFEVAFDCRRADLSGDGGVDGLDLAVLASGFGAEVEPGGSPDLDGSGRVDGDDLALLAARFGAETRDCP